MPQTMSDSPTATIEVRARWKAATLFFGLSLAFWIVSALSRGTENTRAGIETAWHAPWVLEGSSLLVSAALFFFVWHLESRWPIAPGPVLKKVAIHILGSIAFSALHIFLMVMIREGYWIIVFDTEYNYLRNPLEDVLYDYRKDVVTYATILMIIYLSKNLEIAHAEQAEARTTASVKHRLVLKCGGKTVLLAAHDVEAVQADGNYVFVHTGSKSHHARLSLSDALNLLKRAGRDVRRVHKSWLLDFSKVEEFKRTQKGDVDYRLISGREIRGSRRYHRDDDAEISSHP
ncbi:LytTR family DNA-binding domain-containing protein [Maricaulis sp.]|uniref:LytR/AlgR family response regulator transcription factor n=1 Tax=Maricaulis sp. TaxID=1486257 RepID=UPI002B274FFB|nr:LytTR family DNA-binding domain-containing protein [Maricaulis sp.]